MSAEEERFKQILRSNHTSVTSARLAIFHTLLASHKPLKNGEIAARTPDINRASVYRVLDLFGRLGITTTLVRGWTPFIELADPFKPHHHHLLCDLCGKAIAIRSDQIEATIDEIVAKQSFLPTSHHFEINGICKDCQANETPTSPR